MKILFLITLLWASAPEERELKMASPFTDHMVLQQETEAKIWGWATPGKTVHVITSWGEKAKVKASDKGEWLVEIKTPEAGSEPQTISIKSGKSLVELNDVLLGEVWLCSGQSNMEMPVKGWPNEPVLHSSKAIADANKSEIRLYTVEKSLSLNPLDSCGGAWTPCSPDNVADFSASAYFFGLELYNKLGVPIGLIQSTWIDTPEQGITPMSTADMVKARDNNRVYHEWLDPLENIQIKPRTNEDQVFDFNDQEYREMNFDDSNWESMTVPANIESHMGDFDGVLWFRKEFTFDGNVDQDDYKLFLGKIDDMDATYLNGTKVGQCEEGNCYGVIRDYEIPSGLLKKGGNVIAIRVIDARNAGGIIDSDVVGITQAGDFKVNLNGDWKFLPTIFASDDAFYKLGDQNYKDIPDRFFNLNPHASTTIYNGMIAPLIPYSIQGVIWYQGESTIDQSEKYRRLLSTMIQSWREDWDQGDFPFYYVQIPPYNYGEGEGESLSAELREAQLLTLKEKSVGMVVTTDIGDLQSIHPENKPEIGRRLSLWALANVYGENDQVHSGPVYKGVEFSGNRAIISFDHTGSGLSSPDKDLSWFEIAGIDHQFHWANAVIEGNRVVVTSPKVSRPALVRYGWRDIAKPNLFNKEGLPASPFRTAVWQTK